MPSLLSVVGYIIAQYTQILTHRRLTDTEVTSLER